MRIAICDDENICVDTLKNLIIGYFSENNIDLPHIDIFNSGESLLADKSKKDIVFLDIEMPGLDGITTGSKLLQSNKNLILIIVTSYSDYLDDAMRINVFRYISKPIDPARLKRNLDDALCSYNKHLQESIIIPSIKKPVKCYYSDIILLKVSGRKVCVVTKNSEIISDKTLKEWAKLLPNSQFYVCHRSYIINMYNIKMVYPDKVIMEHDFEAYLSKRKYSDIKKKWGKLLLSP